MLLLHSRRVTHRALTADRIVLTSEVTAPTAIAGSGCTTRRGRAREGGEVMLLEPGNGDVAASDLQLRLDLAQLLAELALLVGPERAVASAREKISRAELAAVAPLIQPVVLHRSTRNAARRRKDVLPALRRKRLLAIAPGPEAAPVQLERVPAADAADAGGRGIRGLHPGR